MYLSAYYSGAGGVSNSSTSELPLTWSGNWAAVIGIFICYALLVAWMKEKTKQPEEEPWDH